MNTHDTLEAYSEWLDSNGLVHTPAGDTRTHEDLVRQFMEDWESNRDRQPLAGRVIVEDSVLCVDTLPVAEVRTFGDVDGPLLGLATTADLVAELAARVEVSQTLGEEWPQYKTVDGRPEGEQTVLTPEMVCGLLRLAAPSMEVSDKIYRNTGVIRAMTPGELRQSAEWARAVHLEASDNFVDVPPMPSFLVQFGFEG